MRINPDCVVTVRGAQYVQGAWMRDAQEVRDVQVGEICSRIVAVVRPDEPLVEAVREMDRQHVGSIIVVAPQDGAVRPVGIVTDRDVLCRQLDRKADLFCLSVADVMTPDPLTISETSDIPTAIERMSEAGVRRAPVVDAAGNLVGIVSFDDLLPVLAEMLGALAALIGNQARRER